MCFPDSTGPVKPWSSWGRTAAITIRVVFGDRLCAQWTHRWQNAPLQPLMERLPPNLGSPRETVLLKAFAEAELGMSPLPLVSAPNCILSPAAPGRAASKLPGVGWLQRRRAKWKFRQRAQCWDLGYPHETLTTEQATRHFKYAFRGVPLLIAAISLCPACHLALQNSSCKHLANPGRALVSRDQRKFGYLFYATLSVLFFLHALPRLGSWHSASRSGGPDTNVEIDNCHFTTECVENSHSLQRLIL